jgi:type II secretory pathway pseudopilin PulG
VVILASVALYTALRAGTPLPYPTFASACSRLKDAGLPITPRDWACLPPPWTWAAEGLGATALVWAALALPGIILAASGRRLTALLPMLLFPTFESPLQTFGVHWWGTPMRIHGFWITTALNLLLVAAPAFVIMWLRQDRPRPERTRVTPRAGALAAVVVAGATWVLVGVGGALYMKLVRGNGVEFGSFLFQGALPIAVFGALLGPDRRWWPWSAAPIAILLSFGPMDAMLTGPEHWLFWTRFGYAVPLACIGVVAAGWRPLAGLLQRRLTRTVPAETGPRLAVPMEGLVETPPSAPGVETDVPSRAVRRRLVRPSVAPNAAAIGLLAVSTIMFHADPLSVQISTSLPTFLGARVRAQDVRTRQNLAVAMEAMSDYRATHGTFRGFDASAGKAQQDALGWTNLSDVSAANPAAPLSVIVASATDTRARILARSPSGSVFCIGDSAGESRTYAAVSGGLEGTPPGALTSALRGCAGAQWTTGLTTSMPTADMCDAVGETSYFMCRMTQALLIDIERQPA